MITSLGEKGAGLCASVASVHLFVLYVLVFFLSVFSSSWCRGVATVCDCGIPWTFVLTFEPRNDKNLAVRLMGS